MYVYLLESRFIKEIVCAQLLRAYRDSIFVQLVAILHLILLEEGKAGKYLWYCLEEEYSENVFYYTMRGIYILIFLPFSI